MSDLIDKQQTIDAVAEAMRGLPVVCIDIAKEAIEQLPPANNSEIPNSSDTISRKAAIDIIEDYPHGDWNLETMDDMANMVRQLPPAQPAPSQVVKDIARIVGNGQDMRVIAQPERIKGHWIEHDDGLVACECSVCHEKYALYEEDVFGRNFCPNCGADMR